MDGSQCDATVSCVRAFHVTTTTRTIGVSEKNGAFAVVILGVHETIPNDAATTAQLMEVRVNARTVQRTPDVTIARTRVGV